MTDASAYGLGVVLLQEEGDGRWRPVAFASRVLNKAERNYAPTERECLAVVFALHKWRYYLHGETFVVVTDHLSLKWLLSLKDPRHRLARWVLEIQDFDFIIEHRNGPALVVPDTLSRDAVAKPLCQRCYCPLDAAKAEELAQHADQERVAALQEALPSDRTPTTGRGGLRSGPRNGVIQDKQVEEFGDLNEYLQSKGNFVIDEYGLLRRVLKTDLPVVVPKALVKEVLLYVHGSRLSGHYKFTRTLAKLAGRHWWPTMVRDTKALLRDCLQCAVSDDAQPGRQAALEIVHPSRRFEQVAFDVTTNTPRTTQGNIKVLVIIDVFTRYVRAKAIPDETGETIALALLGEWISVFGPMDALLSDGGSSLVGAVVEKLLKRLGIGHVKTYPLHPQANGTVERWNRTLSRDLASFMTTGADDWDQHVALACFRYNTSACTATGMSPYKAVFGIDAFEAWAELDIDRVMGEPEGLAGELAALHKQLISTGKKARARGKKQYDKTINPVEFNIGERVLLWSVKLNSKEGNKVIKPWIGPYVVIGRLGRVGHQLKSEMGSKIVRVHANRLRRIPDGVIESGDPEDGMFPDSLRVLERISGTQTRENKEGQEERHFKVRIAGQRGANWTAESDLPEAVVEFWDLRHTSRGEQGDTEEDGN